MIRVLGDRILLSFKLSRLQCLHSSICAYHGYLFVAGYPSIQSYKSVLLSLIVSFMRFTVFILLDSTTLMSARSSSSLSLLAGPAIGQPQVRSTPLAGNCQEKIRLVRHCFQHLFRRIRERHRDGWQGKELRPPHRHHEPHDGVGQHPSGWQIERGDAPTVRGHNRTGRPRAACRRRRQTNRC